MRRLIKKSEEICKLSDDPKYKDLKSAWIDNANYRDGNFVVFDNTAYLGTGEHYSTFRDMRDQFKKDKLIPDPWDWSEEERVYPEKYKRWEQNAVTGAYLNDFLGQRSYFISEGYKYDLNELITAFNKIGGNFAIYEIIGMDELKRLY